VPIDERAAVRRLLQRAGFGPSPGELDRAAAAGFDARLDALLDGAPGGTSDAPVLEPLPAQRGEAAQLLRQQVQRIALWWLDRMAAASPPITERLAFFWHGVFATSVQKVRSAQLMLTQNETLRRLGGGEFTALAGAMVTDPAMLVWLDGQRNQRGKPNENLARELMELFTLGVGNYTEEDVKEAARALTGWVVDRASATASLVPRRHDSGQKTVLGVSGNLGAAELVELLVRRPESPRFVAGRMWTRFVSDALPAPERLDELARRATTMHGLLRAVLSAPEFRAPESVLVRQPVEWLVAACRSLGVRPSSAPRPVLAGLRDLGQMPFAPPSVGGWPSGAAWLTTASVRTRLTVATALASAGVPEAVRDAGDRVRAAGELLAVEWTPRTASALDAVAGDPRELVTLALCSPEFTVSG
jgi:uncharacterized protein (DUF1800 family)